MAFGRLQQELAEQHGCLLARLSQLEWQTCTERDKYNSKFLKEMARLGAQAQELEEQSQQPASVLLQDVRANHSRYETKTFASPETIPADLVKKVRDLHSKILPLPEMLRTFSENLAHHLETEPGAVQLDPRTASRSLALAEDRKPARFTRDKQDLTHSPLRSEGVPAARATPGCRSRIQRGQVQPGARGQAVGAAGAEAGSEGAGPERRPQGLAPAAPRAPLPGCAPRRSWTPPPSPASAHTPLRGGLGNRFPPA